ncbi:MAG: hypothetical protein HUJ58_08510 [Erysipelotrichaceae bacterium]|nr:hypothetical protein [Erysipelotrichaceae bacterium]
MNDYMLQTKMPDYAITRQDILKLVRESEPEFREGQMKRLLAHLIETSKIEHVGHNRYRKIKKTVNKANYENRYSETALKIIAIMEVEFSLVDYRIWELSWLNEFMNHQLGRNFIFLEVEKDGCEFIFDRMMSDFAGKVLLKPDSDQIIRYGVNDGIIVSRLISESPKGKTEEYHLTLEKLVVDLFANKQLKGMLSMGDYPEALETVFAVYEVDQVKMFRYARRRNKEKELKEFLLSKTKVELKVS